MWALQKNKNECVPRRRRKILVVSYKEQVKGVIGVRVRETPKSPPHSLLADSLAMRDWCVGWVIQTGILVPTRDQGDIKWHLFEKCVFDCFLLTGSSSGRLKVYRMIWNWSSFRFACQILRATCDTLFSRNQNSATPSSKSNDFFIWKKIKTVIIQTEKEDKKLIVD